MPQIKLAIAGIGWRSHFFAKVASELPEIFQITGALARDKAKGEVFASLWGIPIFSDMSALLAAKPDYVVLLTPREASPGYILDLAKRGVPVLTETPPAPDINTMSQLISSLPPGAKVEVAEQYQFQPMHAARLNVISEGLLGNVSHAQVSCAHGYHGVSLIRLMLNAGYADAKITGCSLSAPLVDGPGRDGPPKAESVQADSQTLALLDFAGKTAVFDFTGAQYFSYIRGNRVLARGERGEINNDKVSYLKSFNDPAYFNLERRDAGQNGNLFGYYHMGIMGSGKWYHENMFAPARLTDDELAVAMCMYKMGLYANGGESFYSVNEGAQDLYLDLMIQQAVATGETIATKSQNWKLA